MKKKSKLFSMVYSITQAVISLHLKIFSKNREHSRYLNWYCNVNFGGNTEYNDGFSYENWGGYNLLVKLNQRNPEVQNYICDVIRFWVAEFDVDGIRLDAADVLDFDFMRALRRTAAEVKEDFWLMGGSDPWRLQQMGKWRNAPQCNKLCPA